MDKYPCFMKPATHAFPPVSKWNLGGFGSVFDGEDGVRVAFWSYPSDEMSEDGTNTCEEYVFVLEGSYTLLVGGEPRPVLTAGDNFLIPKGVVTRRKVLAGTRVIHAFSGAEISRRL